MARRAPTDDLRVANRRKNEDYRSLQRLLIRIGAPGTIDVRDTTLAFGAAHILPKHVDGVKAFEGFGKRKDFKVRRRVGVYFLEELTVCRQLDEKLVYLLKTKLTVRTSESPQCPLESGLPPGQTSPPNSDTPIARKSG